MKKFILVFLPIILLSCQSVKAPTDFEAASLSGKVYSLGNNSVDNALVTLFSHIDGVKTELANSYTDIYGRITFYNVNKGIYSIEVSKEGFETITTDFNFSNRTYVFWVYMISADDLLNSIEEKLDNKSYGETIGLFNRVFALNEENMDALFLAAGTYMKLGEIEKSREYINRFIQLKPYNTWARILSADIYQYYTSEPEKALMELQKIPVNLRNTKVKERIETLKKIESEIIIIEDNEEEVSE